MNRIHPARSGSVPIVPTSELAHAPHLVVRFAVAPDGLPWLLRVDRSHELSKLFRAVCEVFGVARREELPARVLDAVENHVASGLMGVHALDLGDDGEREVYVSRQTIRGLLGPTLLSQLIAPTTPQPSRPSAPPALTFDDDDDMAVSTIAAIAASNGDEALVTAVERAIVDRRSTRRLLLPLAGGRPLSGAVNDDARVLRIPRAPYRTLLEERLTALGAVTAEIRTSGPLARVPVADIGDLRQALIRARQDPYGGAVDFKVPRAGILAALADIAASLAELHRSEHVHADLSPANVLFTAGAPSIFDSLDVPCGSPSTTATFAWAAPEQIIGHPLDPRADVFALGKLAARILGGVPFGEQTHYVVPTGGGSSRTVELLKCEGVFVDITGSDRPRAWQVAWQDLLGRCLAHDRQRRPAHAEAFAAELRDLLERHPPDGELPLPGSFGEIVEIEGTEGRGLARLCAD